MRDGMTGGMVIAVHEAREACNGEPDLVKRIEKAMRAVHNHWMETNRDNQFRSALAAAMLESDVADQDRIRRSMDALRKVGALINAMQAGIPVDIEKLAAEDRAADDPLPLNKMWNAIAA
jgi:hypothetical protein